MCDDNLDSLSANSEDELVRQDNKGHDNNRRSHKTANYEHHTNSSDNPVVERNILSESRRVITTANILSI